MKVKVTSKGQVTLPSLLRKKLKIKEGDYLDTWIHNDGLLLKPTPKQRNDEIIIEYCKEYEDKNVTLRQTQKIMSKIPFSLSERSVKLREK